MPASWLQVFHLDPLAAALLGFVCGVGLYTILINRVLSNLKDGTLKSIFMPLAFLFCLGVPTVLAILVNSSPWILVFFFTLAVMIAGELHYRLVDSRLRSDPPLSISGKPFSFFQPITTRDLRVLHYTAPLSGWAGANLRIAHLSDFHAHTGASIGYFHSVIEQVNQSNPDLVFLTGDFTADLYGIEMLPEIFLPLRSRLGKFAILGNHDFWIDPGRVNEMILQSGLILLPGGCLHPVHDGHLQLTLLGCAAPWSGENCHIEEIPPASPVLALSHTADHIYWLSRAGIAAVFSGHYHAGQFQLPFFGPLIVPSKYGRRFSQGHFKVGKTHLFVSAGVGESHPPLRIYCQPDVLLVDFIGKPGIDSIE